jgi:hypothetical protein
MAKQLKRMNYGGSSTGFNAKTGSKMTPPLPKRGGSGVDNSTTNTTQGQMISFKKGGTAKAGMTKSVTTLKRRK